MNAAVESVGSVIEGGFMTVPEAAAFLRVSRATIYVLMNSGELRSAKLGDKKKSSRRIPRASLLEFAEKCLGRRHIA